MLCPPSCLVSPLLPAVSPLLPSCAPAVGDGLVAPNHLFGIVKRNVDYVVDFLLPVFRSWRARCDPSVIGGRENLVQLAEFVCWRRIANRNRLAKACTSQHREQSD